MSLNPKPFNVAEKIRNRTYLPTPGRLTSVDLNQEKEAHLAAFEFSNGKLGAFTKDVAITVNTLSLAKTFGPITYTLTYDITFSGTTPRIFARTVRFDAWTGAAPTFNGTYGTIITPPTISWWLVAEKQTIDFATDPVMAGVDGPGFPSALSSSDAVVWANEDIIEVRGTTLPALAGNLEYICKVGAVVYRDDTYLNTAADYTPIFVCEAVDTDDLVTSLLNINGTQTLSLEGSKPNSVVEILQRLAIITNDIYLRLPTLNAYSDVITVSTTTVFTNNVIRNLVQVVGAATDIILTLPPVANLLDNDSVKFINNGIFKVTLTAGSGTTIGGAATHVLFKKGSAVELVFDSSTNSWAVASYFTRKRFENTYNFPTNASTTLTVEHANSHIEVSGNTTTKNFNLPNITTMENGDTITFFNASTYQVNIGSGTDWVGYVSQPDIDIYQQNDFIELVADKANSLWRIANIKSTPTVSTTPIFVFNTISIALSAATSDILKFQTNESGDAGLYDTLTGRFTPTVAGVYELKWSVIYQTNGVPSQLYAGTNARKNGVQIGFITDRQDVYTTSDWLTLNGSVIVEANGTTDYFDLQVYSSIAVAKTIYGNFHAKQIVK